jgi:FMN phosphatase YigB (HAD superfamily)
LIANLYFFIKPQKALSIMGLRAEECVFIDDLEENCAGARAVGIKSIWVGELFVIMKNQKSRNNSLVDFL